MLCEHDKPHSMVHNEVLDPSNILTDRLYPITSSLSGRGSPSGRTGLWWQPPSGFDSLLMRKLPCLFWTPKRYWVRSSPGKALPGEVDRCLTGPRGMIREAGTPGLSKKKKRNSASLIKVFPIVLTPLKYDKFHL